MITIDLTPSGRVTCRATFELPVPQSVAWGQLRDFRRFAAQDFFHHSVRTSPGGPCVGASLELDHRFGPFRTTRVGRILQWRELHGYSFSDLSPRGPRRAFPHVYRYRLRPLSPDRCRVEVTVAGLWTTPLVPRPLVRLWLAWVFSHIATSARNALVELTARAGEQAATSPLRPGARGTTS
jgi:hypothetical protein